MSAETPTRTTGRIHPYTFAGLLECTLDDMATPSHNSDRLNRAFAAQAEYIRKSVACLRRVHREIVELGSPTVGTLETAAGLIELGDLPIPQAMAKQEDR